MQLHQLVAAAAATTAVVTGVDNYWEGKQLIHPVETISHSASLTESHSQGADIVGSRSPW